MNGILELSGMTFHAFHGCLESERRDGNTFVVDFRAEIDMSRAIDSDNLEDTINYAGIYDIVSSEMAIASKLLEHVCGRIVKSIHERYPEIQVFSVKVSKQNPPVNGPAATSSVTLGYGKPTLL